ncbi:MULTISPECIES: filamentous hemagglutinin N-terminal domain-containing protein [unclassified Janthinobacterium]|uniref:two-partner secretion domain-containing protein n=1 Tax=unclassified Janthinobacterium TaxID=2610881 RepID=UPI001608D94A|nr:MULTISPECIES: filamentous hemagglutinin N-terminal domain-containing protein [unclassified Janthinobacterium]MBB5608926.1 filamentous hemagglutinin family protein [Janthinobacterium sp. S3T4]MBB5615219.1 filamentous hemagglutinin family protein [Janthinobacterium sp. S3M3]
MNHVYHLVWNHAQNAWVVAPETAKANGKGRKRVAASTIVAAALSLFSLHAAALPTGGQVTAGQATIGQAGNTLNVNQSTQNLAVNWNSFNIGASETVNFVQPNSSAIALNRVLGSDASAIYGKLNANGQVFLLNPNGILFGKGAQVNVGGLVASTLSLSDADLLNRNFRFSGSAGSVVNQGSLTGGYVALLGGQVSNQGTISARLGGVALAAGKDITLDFAGDGLIGVQVNQGTLNALADNQQLIQTEGGAVLLSARAADSLIAAVVNNSGVIEARSIGQHQGTIRLSGDPQASILSNTGTLTADSIDASARTILQSGAIVAGDATLTASHALLQTDNASITANTLRVDGGATTFISGKLDGASSVTVAGQDITLAGARVSTGDKGSIRIGGGAHGRDAGIANAATLAVNGSSSISAGDQAQVVLWSDRSTGYFGQISAGKHSFVEVSSQGTLNLGGAVRTGAGSEILFDPTNIVIDATAPASYYVELGGPAVNDGEDVFSNDLHALQNGNVLINSYLSNLGAAQGGAVYLYDGSTGALKSVLTGSNANDRVGNEGITELRNSSYVISSSIWNGNRGAVTWGDGDSGVKGVVSVSNSLVGSKAGDYVGKYGIAQLSNGNYLVDSVNWNNNSGAVTWGDGKHGIQGEVSASNSLVGSTNGDQVGNNGIRELSNGNYLVLSGNWNGNSGAITWGNGNTGVSGEVSSVNSLVGGNANDHIGNVGIMELSDGNYLVRSGNWNNTLGAITWGNGATGISGVVSADNSLVGSVAGDQVGNNGITLLSNGNYLVRSNNWNGTRGAVTWGNSATGVTGEVSADNSLIGSTSGDRIGGDGITEIGNGNYVVRSAGWSTNRGAVTWGDGATGVTGVVSADNSLVGGTAGDRVGVYDVTKLANGNYVANSNLWNGGVGAVTWGDGNSGVKGVISADNSLIGSTAGDRVGMNGITALANGNYVVPSSYWGGSRGAITWGDGNSGVKGIVSADNSLLGSASGDMIGISGITQLSNSNYLVRSSNWNGSRGAITWGDGAIGIKGVVSDANSLVGSTSGDMVGSNGVMMLSNGNYLVLSSRWNDGHGAVTWGDGNSGVKGFVSEANSLVGSRAGDYVGNNGITQLSNGNYVVRSSNWNDQRGAVTWGDGNSGVTGVISDANSLVGSTSGDMVGSNITTLSNGNYLVSSSNWNDHRGAVTWGNGATGITGVVSDANSLVGTTSGDQVGSNGITLLSNGNYLVNSSNWNDQRGAVTWGDGKSGIQGEVSAANSLVGAISGDQVGNNGYMELSNGNYLVLSNLNDGRGAVTFGDGKSGAKGVVSADNSLIGSKAGDLVGDDGGVQELANGNYVVLSSSWNDNRGAITWGDGKTGVRGEISSANSLLGSKENDYVGYDGVQVLASGDYLVRSSQWNDKRGAITWGNGKTGVKGEVSSGNSLVGANAGDNLGNQGVTELGNGNYVVASASGDASTNPSDRKASYWLVASPANLAGMVNNGNGDVTVSPAALAVAAGAGSTVTLQASNDITVNSAVSIEGKLQLIAGHDVTLNASITSTAEGDALVLSGERFVNNAGADALSTPNGRWLVYSADPANDTQGGLVSGNADVWNATYAANAPDSITAGSRFVHAAAEPIPPVVVEPPVVVPPVVEPPVVVPPVVEPPVVVPPVVEPPVVVPPVVVPPVVVPPVVEPPVVVPPVVEPPVVVPPVVVPPVVVPPVVVPPVVVPPVVVPPVVEPPVVVPPVVEPPVVVPPVVVPPVVVPPVVVPPVIVTPPVVVPPVQPLPPSSRNDYRAVLASVQSVLAPASLQATARTEEQQGSERAPVPGDVAGRSFAAPLPVTLVEGGIRLPEGLTVSN